MGYTNQRMAYGKTLVELGRENRNIVDWSHIYLAKVFP